MTSLVEIRKAEVSKRSSYTPSGKSAAKMGVGGAVVAVGAAGGGGLYLARRKKKKAEQLQWEQSGMGQQ